MMYIQSYLSGNMFRLVN